MRLHLVTLRRDPRLIASTGAILWLFVDNHPAQPYGTFRDPGAALMLSLVFGNTLAIAYQRQWDQIGTWLLVAATLFKLDGQSLFLFRDTGTLDWMFLLMTHFVIGAVAFRDSSFEMRMFQAIAGAVAVLVGLCVFQQLEDNARDHHSYKGLYFTYALIRALIPYLFWTALLIVAWISQKLKGATSCVSGSLPHLSTHLPQGCILPESGGAMRRSAHSRRTVIFETSFKYFYFASLLAETVPFLSHTRWGVRAFGVSLAPLVIGAGIVSLVTGVLFVWRSRDNWPYLVLAMIVHAWCAHPND